MTTINQLPIVPTIYANSSSFPTGVPIGSTAVSATGPGIYLYDGATWNQVAGGGASGVTSVAGTANQVLVNGTSGSPVTGVLALTLPQSIDTGATVQFSVLSLGGSAQGNTQLTLNPTGQYGLYMTSTLAQTGVDLYASRINNIISPATSFNTYGYAFTGVFNAVSGRTIPSAYVYYSSVTVSAAGGTITNLFNYYAGIGSSSVGTLTNFYGFYSAALAIGTNRYGAYLSAPSGGTIAIACYADNFSAGYNVSPPGNGMIISGQLGLGTSAPNSLAKLHVVSSSAYHTYLTGTQTNDDGSTLGTIVMSTILAPANNNVTAWGAYLLPTFRAAVAQTIGGASTIWATASASGNSGTITNLYTIHVDIGTAGGTVTNGYGIYIRTLAYGTNRTGLYVDAQSGGGGTNICAYFGGPVKWNSNTTGAGSALLGTNSPAVTNTAPYTWITMISSDGSTVYVPAWK